jgi:hypothetical protein
MHVLILILILLAQTGHLGFELPQSLGLADALVVGMNDTDSIGGATTAAGCWSRHIRIAAEFALSATCTRFCLHVVCFHGNQSRKSIRHMTIANRRCGIRGDTHGVMCCVRSRARRGVRSGLKC